MYSLPAKIAIDKEITLNDCNLEGLSPVRLSAKPNSNIGLKTVDNYAESYASVDRCGVSASRYLSG